MCVVNTRKKYGAQTFYINNKELWDIVNNIVEFNINGHVAENVVEVKY